MKLFAGPCSLESKELCFEVARTIRDNLPTGIDYYFKTSFAKENRSSSTSFMGHGLDYAKDVFTYLRADGFKIITDVHETWQVEEIAPYVDALQIPAFLCRQTPLLRAAAETGLLVNVKKGQFLAPWDVTGILSKTGMKNVLITERGTCFGYNNLVVDFTGLVYMIKEYQFKHGVPIVFDGTHCVQKPGGLGESSGGNREYVPYLLRAAASVGVENFFMEVHEEPDKSPSDGPNILHLEDFEGVLKSLKRIQHNI